MRRLLLTILLLFALCVSCTNDKTDDSKADFSLSVAAIDATDIGGEFEVRYSLSEYVGSVMPVATTDVEWIVDVDNSERGVIRFRVLPNFDAEAREAALYLKYINTSTKPKLLVRQEGCSDDKLTMRVANIDYSECTVELSATDKTMPYIVMMAEKSYFRDSNISTADELVYSDSTLFSSYAVDSTLEEYMLNSGFMLMGDKSKRWQDLSPAKEYVVYAYGIYVSGDEYERITPIYHLVVGKRMPERVEQSFDVNIEAEGPEVRFNVKPESWTGYYCVQVVEDSEAGYIEQGLEFTPKAEEQVAESFFYVADHLYYFEEKSAEEVMQQLGYKGETTFSKTLSANHRYMAIIYAIASDEGRVPMVVSRPQIEYFTTGTVNRSDMTFEVEFSNIRPRSVDVRIVPTTDESYTAVMMYAKNLPKGDKQEQLDYVMTKYAPLDITGIYEEHIDQLPPDTEFVIAVYGYYAGAPTTDLFVYNFATAKDGKGENRIVNVKFSAYDMAEVVAIEPYYKSMLGYADYFLSMEVETLMPAPALHFELYAKSQYDSYTHEDILESILEYAYTSSPDWALCTYDREYVLCGVAEDENGYVGEMYISEPISFSREQVGDAQEFVELYKEWTN